MTNNQPSPGWFFGTPQGKLTLPSLKAHLLFWPLMAAGFALDLWTKAAVFDWLKQKPNNSVSVIDGFLQLILAQNDGAAFGLFSGQRYKLIAISIIALIVILVIFLSSKNERKLFYIGLGISTGGICGNLYDRVFNDGLVRDFIDVYITIFSREYHWPAFNIGDSVLCVGVALMFISIFSTERPYRKHGRQHR